MKKSRPFRGSERGQVMVEFAMMAVFLMVLILAFIELVMLLYTYNVVADSAKEGVRYAIVHGSSNTAGCGPAACTAITGPAGTGIVKTYAKYSLHDTTTMTVNVSYNPNGANGANPCNTAPCLVQVTVSYPYQPFFGLGWPKVTVNAAAEGRIVF